MKTFITDRTEEGRRVRISISIQACCEPETEETQQLERDIEAEVFFALLRSADGGEVSLP